MVDGQETAENEGLKADSESGYLAFWPSRHLRGPLVLGPFIRTSTLPPARDVQSYTLIFITSQRFCQAAFLLQAACLYDIIWTRSGNYDSHESWAVASKISRSRLPGMGSLCWWIAELSQGQTFISQFVCWQRAGRWFSSPMSPIFADMWASGWTQFPPFTRGKDALPNFEYGRLITMPVMAGCMAHEQRKNIDPTDSSAVPHLEPHVPLIQQGSGAEVLVV